jgi:aminoglycoside phosphotransferase (APT) family kinase protein
MWRILHMKRDEMGELVVSNMPTAEVHIDGTLVRRLLVSQFPEWASLRISPSPLIGWDNVSYRLGSHLVVRLPRRRMGAVMVEKQHQWLPELARRLPLPVPVPIGRGAPEHGYPWQWSVCRWIPGDVAVEATIDDLTAFAEALGAFLVALATPGPGTGPRSPFRGGALATRDDQTRESLARLADVIDTTAATRLWDDALALPASPEPGVWLHGDLQPANLLVEAGRLSGVIDFDHVGVGDPAVDLISAWMLLPESARPALRATASPDEATWARGRAWALHVGLLMLSLSADEPLLARLGERTIHGVLADHD